MEAGFREIHVAQIDDQSLTLCCQPLADGQYGVFDMPVQFGKIKAVPVDIKRVVIVIVFFIPGRFPLIERDLTGDVFANDASAAFCTRSRSL